MERKLIKDIYKKVKNDDPNIYEELLQITKITYNLGSKYLTTIFGNIFNTIADYPNYNISLDDAIELYIMIHLVIPDIDQQMKEKYMGHKLQWLFNPHITDNTTSNTTSDYAPIGTTITYTDKELATYKLAYIRLCNNISIPVEDTHYERFFHLIKKINPTDISFIQECLRALYHLGPSNTIYSGISLYRKIRQYLANPWRCTRELPLLDGHVAVVMDNLVTASSDYQGAESFLKGLKSLGYHVTIIHNDRNLSRTCHELETHAPYLIPNGAINRDLFDDEFIFDVDNLPKVQYKYAFYITHLHVSEMILSSMRLGETQIGILGHLITSGLDQMDYFIVPHWDRQDNYTEQVVRLPGMACTIPRTIKTGHPINKKQCPTDIHIAILLVGNKMTSQIGSIMRKINRGSKSKIRYLLLYGKNSALTIKAFEHRWLKGIKNYVSISNELDIYYSVLNSCDFVLCPYPYSPYISLVDTFAAMKPAVALMDESRNSTCCAAKILQQMGLPIAANHDEYIKLAIQYADNDNMRMFIVEKMRKTPFNKLIDEHNSFLQNEFKYWMKSII